MAGALQTRPEGKREAVMRKAFVALLASCVLVFALALVGCAGGSADSSSNAASNLGLENGVYSADFTTDGSMFHVNEACDGKGTLTVADDGATIHVSLVSKKIVNLYPGTAADAQKEGAVLLKPTVDAVTYDDGTTDEVYGFDIPVPALDEEFDVALIGEKGTWYDHKVRVSNPEPQK
jgi:hypothetical protein